MRWMPEEQLSAAWRTLLVAEEDQRSGRPLCRRSQVAAQVTLRRTLEELGQCRRDLVEVLAVLDRIVHECGDGAALLAADVLHRHGLLESGAVAVD